MKAKDFTKRLKSMARGEKIVFTRGESILTFQRHEFDVSFWFGPDQSGMTYEMTIPDAADWFCSDDGKGEYVERPVAEVATV